MIHKFKHPLSLSLIFLIAAGMRLPHLSLRPMHTDEAVHAVKFGALLENGSYQYDPVEYHGPTLYFFTWILAKTTGQDSLQDVTDSTLRMVPVLFGILLIGFTFWLVPGLGWPAILTAGLLTALSPAFVFYSRYYIQEILLVCFTTGWITSSYRYLTSEKWGWIILSGIFFGLMHATKETSIITWWAAGSALLILWLLRNGFYPSFRKPSKRMWTHLTVFVVAGAITSTALFSNGFTYPKGILDSFSTYANYFFKAGQNSLHNHPSCYYFQHLFCYQSGEQFWSEWPILLFAIMGLIRIFHSGRKFSKGNPLHQFIALYAILLTAVYILIPYKTPWSMLSFYHAWILLAGMGFIAFLDWTAKSKLLKTSAFVLLVIGTSHLAYQAWTANFKCQSSPANPYVYAHPTEDVFKISNTIQSLMDEQSLPIHVIVSNHEYWPLPWYLRNLENIGWYADIPDDWTPAPVLLFSEEFKEPIIKKLYVDAKPGERDLYVPLFDKELELRPGQPVLGYIRYDVLNRISNHK